MLLLTLTGAVLSTIMTVLVSLYLKTDSSAEEFTSIGYGSSAVILILSIMIPFVIKMGVERARLIFVAVYIVPFVLIMLLKQIVEKQSLVIPEWLNKAAGVVINNINIIGPAAVLLVLIASYYISVSIYKKKDL